MSPTRVAGLRRLAVAVTALIGTAVALVLLLAPDGRGQAAGGGQPLPVLGAADAGMTLMGGAPASGEAWGFRELPLDVPPPSVNGNRLEFGPLPTGRDPQQLAFLRHGDATGWQIVDVPLDADGRAYRGPAPNPQSASITPRGGGLLVGRDNGRPTADQLVALIRDPGGRYRERRPPDEVLPEPAGVLEEGEALAGDRGQGRVAAAAFERGDRTGAYFGAIGSSVEDAVVRFDGAVWTREPIVVPAGVTSARIVALDAAAETEAYLLLETTTADGRGVELYRRTGAGATAAWVERPLGDAVFADRADPARGLSELGPLDGSADPLSVTTDGAWVDGSLLAVGPDGGDPVERDFTLFYDTSEARVSGSWCDAVDSAGARVCARDLGVAFDRGNGYRSEAFAGDGFGTRAITNPLDVGGDEASNRGTYLRFAGETFERRRGASGNGRPSGAFTSADRGWLEGPVEIGAGGRPDRLRRWPVALRSTLTAAVAAPAAPSGALESGALAAGADGAIARYVPGQGWIREFLLTANGSVARPRLRGVAWPEPARAHAVGDLGALWQWRADTGLWERDPATPIGFEANLLDVAFQAGAPDRGFAVGRAGTLLRYDKTWTQDAVPGGFEPVDLTSVTFAGPQALVAAGADLLVNDGSGWRVDEGLRSLLDQVRRGRPQLRVVRGLPDGGAVAAGRDFVVVRDGSGSGWRFSDQPLPDQTVVAAAPFRAGDRVRALVAVQPRLSYPQLDDPVQIDPDVPPPILPAQPLPGDGYLLRETDSGWRDERRTAFSGTSIDRPIKTDPVQALVVDAGGSGWAIGGWSGEPDFAGRGTRQAVDRSRVQTAAIFRYGPDGSPPGPPARTEAAVPLPGGPLRLAVGGHAQCEDPCADLADQDLAPDRLLRAAIDQAARMAAQPGGPRAFLNTGGRLKPEGDRGLSSAEARRYAQLLASPGGLPVYSAVSASDSAGPAAATPFSTELAGAPAPFGTGGLPGGVSTDGIPGIGATGGARTHYAFDVAGAGGARVRVAVIDNSRGSLAESDPHQNPREDQLPWLRAVLADAKARGVASVVVGSRDLSRFAPRLNAASDGDEVAQALVDGGASAYFFERPEENRSIRIPSGAADQIPAFGTGTLGYRSPVTEAGGQDVALSTFGDRAILLAEVDLAKRDATTNRAPVAVRPIPVIEDLSLQATDGTLLRRSRPSLFQGLGRRPESGDRWGEPSGVTGPSPPGGDPYTLFPAEPCLAAGCATRLTPEVQFTSSRPDIGDFVQQDPASTNLRKPLIGADDRVITDNRSGLFCPFNPGETTVTIRSGGIAFAQKVTVLAGTAQRPCGTRPTTAPVVDALAPVAPAVAAPELPALAPTAPPPPPIDLPPPPAPQPPAAVAVAAPSPPRPAPPAPPFVPAPLLATPLVTTGSPPITPPPPATSVARPIPPGGVAVRVFEEKREEELAPEQSQAFSAYEPDAELPWGPLTIGAVVLLAVTGASVRNGRRDRRRELALASARTDHDHPYRRNR